MRESARIPEKSVIITSGPLSRGLFVFGSRESKAKLPIKSRQVEILDVLKTEGDFAAGKFLNIGIFTYTINDVHVSNRSCKHMAFISYLAAELDNVVSLCGSVHLQLIIKNRHFPRKY